MEVERLFFFLDGFTVAGLTILKKDLEESKICTLMIHEDYRKKGYGKELLESSFEYLKTDKPLITIPSNRIQEFSSIISSYDWKESTRTNQYLSEEVIFNAPKQYIKK